MKFHEINDLARSDHIILQCFFLYQNIELSSWRKVVITILSFHHSYRYLSDILKQVFNSKHFQIQCGSFIMNFHCKDEFSLQGWIFNTLVKWSLVYAINVLKIDCQLMSKSIFAKLSPSSHFNWVEGWVGYLFILVQPPNHPQTQPTNNPDMFIFDFWVAVKYLWV